MRILFGILLGAALTEGLAYMIDRRRLADPRGEGPFVNWERVDKSLREGWRALTQ